jgi:hypothetical protein
MDILVQAAVRNKLLLALDAVDFARLVPYLEPVQLPRLYKLSSPGMIADYCYFPDAGIGSIVAEVSGGRKAEIGIFGREGMSPTALIMHVPTTPYSIFMQVAGHGHRIQSMRLSHAADESLALRTLLLRYAQTMAVQASFTALSNATGNIEQRLARWLLMCQDRSDSNIIALTHAFLSIMLAVRRQSITTALHVLEGRYLITAERNQITIRDRPGLEAFAGGAYGPAEDDYRRLVGSF